MKTKPIRTIDQLSAKEIEDCSCSDLEKYFLDVTSIKEIAKRSTIKETGYVDILLFSERFPWEAKLWEALKHGPPRWGGLYSK